MSSPLASAITGLAVSRPPGKKKPRRTRFIALAALLQTWPFPYGGKHAELAGLLLGRSPVVTVGLAVERATFGRIRVANGTPRLAEVPAEQDAEEFELHFPDGVLLDVLHDAGAGAAPERLPRYLAKFGEARSRWNFAGENVDRATEILKEKFNVKPVYPATRPGADGTPSQLLPGPTPAGGKVLIDTV